jgi:hypothetical protein
METIKTYLIIAFGILIWATQPFSLLLLPESWFDDCPSCKKYEHYYR